MPKQVYPTNEQESKCLILCQKLTSLYQPIYLVRLDERTGNIFILAGEEIEIVIDRDGQWGFES